MKEELFKLGGVYRQENGDLARLVLFRNNNDTKGWGRAEILNANTGEVNYQDGARRFLDGKYPHDSNNRVALTPGELEFVNGQWLPISASAPVVEEKTPERAFDECLTRARTVMADLLNAEMIARDDTAAARRQAENRKYLDQVEQMLAAILPASNAHPPIPALCLSPDTAEGYRLGGRFGTVR